MTQSDGSPDAAVPLRGMTIGISISDSEDLGRLNMGEAQLQQAYLEMTRHLLANGAVVAYGGDHRDRGFTEILLDLVRAYDQPDQPATDRTVNYLAWPLHLTLTDEYRAELLNVARLEALPAPPALVEEFGFDPSAFLAPNTTQNRYVWARSLVAMREKMNQEIDARLVLGGQTARFLGRYPGIAEEAYLALQAQKPIYLLGGFGGCARELIDLLQGGAANRLTAAYQQTSSQHAQDYTEFMDYYNGRHPDDPIDYAALREVFVNSGIAGLRNGLDESDNLRLFETDDVDVMVALVLKGLVSLH